MNDYTTKDKNTHERSHSINKTTNAVIKEQHLIDDCKTRNTLKRDRSDSFTEENDT